MAVHFVSHSNNGVTALINIEWHNRIWDQGNFCKSDGSLDFTSAIREGLRIFTFCNASRLLSNPRELRYFTGINEDITPLLEMKGRENSGVWTRSFYVPFSNGWGNMRNEHEFAVSPSDVFHAFGPGAKTSIL